MPRGKNSQQPEREQPEEGRKYRVRRGPFTYAGQTYMRGDTIELRGGRYDAELVAHRLIVEGEE